MTMAKTKTAREELAWIERTFFKGASLAKAIGLEGEARRDYRLAQVERLLSDMRMGGPLAMYLSDRFWTAAEGREPMPWEDTPATPETGYLTNPLLSLEEQQTLTDSEMGRLRLILEVAGLCHDLSLHFTFDLKEAFGMRKNDFLVSNKRLVEWVSTTPYEQIAMHTAYIMKKRAIRRYEYSCYQPAQDALAELFSSEYTTLIREPNDTKIPPRDYVRIILDEMLRIERHWQRGRRLKLRPDVVILHDEIYGVVPRQFDKGVLQAAQALFDYMDSELYGRLVEADDFAAGEVMDRFAAKVREVRAQYFAEGWIEDGSLEFSYLMAHAERCGEGFWREEDGL